MSKYITPIINHLLSSSMCDCIQYQALLYHHHLRHPIITCILLFISLPATPVNHAAADVILWRNKQLSAALLAASTVIWMLFEWIGYHLIPFICHFLILSLATLFLWSNLAFYVHKSPLNLPEIELPEDLCMTVAFLLRDRCNQAICILWEMASGKDLKRFSKAIFALWVVSIVGSWFDLLTIVYIAFVMILTMPPLYEKHEAQVDSYALKAKAKLKRQITKLDDRVLKKLPKVPFISDTKQQ